MMGCGDPKRTTGVAAGIGDHGTPREPLAGACCPKLGKN